MRRRHTFAICLVAALLMSSGACNADTGADDWRLADDAEESRPPDAGPEHDARRADTGPDANFSDTGSPDDTGPADDTGRHDRSTDTDPDTRDATTSVDHRETVRSALRARSWARTTVSSYGTYVGWHLWRPTSSLRHVETYRRRTDAGENAPALPDPIRHAGSYEVFRDGSVEWTIPSSTDPPARKQYRQTFVAESADHGVVELSEFDRVVDEVDRVWPKRGLRAQNPNNTRYYGVTAEFTDNYDDDDHWNSGRRIERTVTFDRPLRPGMETCRFDLTLEVAYESMEGLMTARETFRDLACSVPLEDGPEYDVVVDRFADADRPLDEAWRQFLVDRGIDEDYGREFVRLFERGFRPAFRFDRTRPGVLLMGDSVPSLMVGTRSDGPPSEDAS